MTTKSNRVLMVDDNATNLAVLEEILGDTYQTATAKNGLEALEVASRFHPDLILLDIMMPGMDGYGVCQTLRRTPSLAHVKVIMLSAKAMTAERIAGYQAGADDYITKPFDEDELLSKVQVFLRMKRIEETSAQNQTLVAELEASNKRLEAEIRRRQKAEEQLRHDSLHDVLTHLPNRALLLDRINRCIMRMRRENDFGFAVLFLDLDDFKVVNDSLGHEAGDVLLVEVANRLAASLRDLDSVCRPDEGTTARLGGDEFVLLLEGVRSEADALTVEGRIREALTAPIVIAGQELRPNGSIGIAFGCAEYTAPGDVLRDADIAMYQAKASGKCRTAIFSQHMRDRAISRQRLELDLQKALTTEQLYLHYQPIVSLTTGQLHGFEALCRWDHPERGILAPSEFIPLAEETGLIVPLGEWVMQRACSQVAAWRSKYPDRSHLSISINVSGKQLVASPVHLALQRALETSGLDPQYVNLELTETVMIDTRGGAERCLAQFASQNIGLHMDDFGTGYSSLSYLTRLPISAVKLDGSFIADMLVSRAGGATVRAVLQMAHSRDLKVIAEGVERPEQVAALRQYGCDLAQGFYFSPPVSAEAAERLLASTEDWAIAS